MTLVRRLERRWLKDESLQALDAEGVKAIIDALALAMYADFESDIEEEGAFAGMILSLPVGWAETAELSDHASDACERAAAIFTAEGMLEAARVAAGRIPAQVKRQAFEMVAAITIADRELKLGEAAVLSAFGEALGFDEDDALAMYDEILNALGLSDHA